MAQLFIITYISVDLAHYQIVHAKVGKGGACIRIRCGYKMATNNEECMKFNLFNIHYISSICKST